MLKSEIKMQGSFTPADILRERTSLSPYQIFVIIDNVIFILEPVATSSLTWLSTEFFPPIVPNPGHPPFAIFSPQYTILSPILRWKPYGAQSCDMLGKARQRCSESILHATLFSGLWHGPPLVSGDDMSMESNPVHISR